MAIGAGRVDHQKLLECALGGEPPRIARGIPEDRQRFERIDHGGKDGAEAVLAVQPFEHPGLRAARGVRAYRLRDQGIDHAAQPVERQEGPAQDAFAPAGAAKIVTLLLGRCRKQLANLHVAWVPGGGLARAQNEQRHHHRARPVGDLVEMERKPARQEHDLDRHIGHGAPRNLPEQRECDAREHVAAGRAAALQNCRTRPHHVGSLGAVARELQGKVGLDGAAHVEVAAVVQRPAAMLGLTSAQISRELRFQRSVNLLQEVRHQDILGGNGTVRLQLEQPIALRALQTDQRVARGGDGAIQRREFRQPVNLVRGCVGARRVRRDRERTPRGRAAIHGSELPSDRPLEPSSCERRRKRLYSAAGSGV